MTNHSFDYQDICGEEPDTSAPNGWALWTVWFRRFSKHFPASNGTIDENGFVHYHPLLKSQRTRHARENKP